MPEGLGPSPEERREEPVIDPPDNLPNEEKQPVPNLPEDRKKHGEQHKEEPLEDRKRPFEEPLEDRPIPFIKFTGFDKTDSGKIIKDKE